MDEFMCRMPTAGGNIAEGLLMVKHVPLLGREYMDINIIAGLLVPVSTVLGWNWHTQTHCMPDFLLHGAGRSQRQRGTEFL